MHLFNKKQLSSSKRKVFYDWLKAVGIVILVIIFIRVFMFESYTIPTTSMEKTLIDGDYILVSKLNFGARTPVTPLSLPFFKNVYYDSFQLPYFRLPGFTNIKVNDVIVFNYPEEANKPLDKKTLFIKRCVATAGDTFKIKNGKVFINDKELNEPENAEFNYIVKTDSSEISPENLEKSGITEGGYMFDNSTYNLTMTKQNAEKINKFSNVLKTDIIIEDSGKCSENLFPSSIYYSWNLDNYGPIVIPEKGMTIKINKITLPLYYRIISVYEDNKLIVKNDSLFEINGKPAITYTFKKNYYFALGDNRHNSADSRYWGFIPEDHIVGKAVMIWFSIDKNKKYFNRIRYDRFFKLIE